MVQVQEPADSSGSSLSTPQQQRTELATPQHLQQTELSATRQQQQVGVSTRLESLFFHVLLRPLFACLLPGGDVGSPALCHYRSPPSSASRRKHHPRLWQSSPWSGSRTSPESPAMVSEKDFFYSLFVAENKQTVFLRPPLLYGLNNLCFPCSLRA